MRNLAEENIEWMQWMNKKFPHRKARTLREFMTYLDAFGEAIGEDARREGAKLVHLEMVRAFSKWTVTKLSNEIIDDIRKKSPGILNKAIDKIEAAEKMTDVRQIEEAFNEAAKILSTAAHKEESQWLN